MVNSSPYVYEGSDNVADMTGRVAHAMVDPGQAEVDIAEIFDKAEVMSAQRVKTFAGVVLGPRSETVAFTVAELKAFCLERFHTTQKLRTVDWALDEQGSLDDFGLKVKASAAT